MLWVCSWSLVILHRSKSLAFEGSCQVTKSSFVVYLSNSVHDLHHACLGTPPQYLPTGHSLHCKNTDSQLIYLFVHQTHCKRSVRKTMCCLTTLWFQHRTFYWNLAPLMSYSSNLLFNFYCCLLCCQLLIYSPNPDDTNNKEKKINRNLLGALQTIHGAI